MSTEVADLGEIEQVSALAAALCRPNDHELLRDGGLNVLPVVMSPPPKAQVRRPKWNPPKKIRFSGVSLRVFTGST